MKVQKWHQERYFSDFQGSHNKQNTSGLCFIFVTSLCLPPKKWTFYSPLVCFALLSVRIVTCDLLGLWPVFPDCALSQAISCIVWQPRDETTGSKLIANMTCKICLASTPPREFICFFNLIHRKSHLHCLQVCKEMANWAVVIFAANETSMLEL